MTSTRGFTAHGSSTIEMAEYDTQRELLTVTFRDGAVYEYFDVPQSIYEGFEASRSKGEFHATAIRNEYGFRRI